MSERSEILIAGAGAAGLTLGIALAEAGFEVTIVGRLDRRRNGRTVALFEASLRLYRALGLWERLAPQAAPMAVVRIIDDTGSPFRQPPAEFDAGEIDLPAFGQNIENADLVAELAAAARQTPGLQLIEGCLTDYQFRPESVAATLEDGCLLEAALIVGADGRGSPLRAAAGIGVREWTYPQVVLTAILSHAEPHLDTSTEFHTREGPFTLVPLPPRAGRPHRSSLVWLMNPREAERRLALEDAALVAEIEQHAHAMLGAMALEGERGSFPVNGMRARRLTAPRLALVGDAGHFFPPIGAQGLNLGLRDVAELVECLEGAPADAGAAAVLDRYEQHRAADIVSRTLGVDLLNRSLLFDLPPVDFARAAGMVAVRTIGPLRRAIMREGILPRGRLPRLMRQAGASMRKSGPAGSQTGLHDG
jgi:2-octaprenyl-6-methoxyphenol hydroxylase